MEQAEFWSLIEDARRKSGSCEELAELLLERLAAESEAVSAGFAAVMDQLLDQAYRWDLWGAAYVINGGCSDDGFEYFRGWLIAQGESRFKQALADPDSLADFAEEDVECEDLLYVAQRAYERHTGRQELPQRYAPHPAEPAGEEWTEEDLDELFPKLTAAFG